MKIQKGEHKKIVDISRGGGGLKKVYIDQFDKIIDVKFSKSYNENFIQIADLCAYNVYRQFVHYGREWQGEGEKKTMSLYEFFDKIRYNFFCHPETKKVSGYGLICLPDVGKKNWTLLE